MDDYVSYADYQAEMDEMTAISYEPFTDSRGITWTKIDDGIWETEPTDEDLAALEAELDADRFAAFDARDAQIAFVIRAAVEDLALATISPWATEPPY